MATDWAADVKKYVADADDAAIAGIVRYCGIALRNRDSSLVAFSDKSETDRVRNNFLKKKLGLTQSDAVLDKAIAKVGEVMKADRTKNRVTVYYLLAAEFKKLDMFVKKAAAAKAPAKAPAAKAEAKAPAKKTAAKAAGAAAAVAGAAAAAKAPAKKAAAPKAAVAKPTAAAKKVAAPKKAAAPKKVATLKAAPAKLMDKAADAANDASKTSAAAVAGTVAAVGAVGAAAVAAASGAADTVKDTASKAVEAAGDAAGAAAGAVTGAAGAAADKAGALFSGGGQAASSGDEDSGLGWLWWALGIALVVFAIWWYLHGRTSSESAVSGAPTEAVADAGTAASGAAVDLAAAPAEGSAAIPEGAGVTSELRDGKPVVKVYFDTGKTDVASAFTATAGGLKGWLDSHSGTKLAISGYSDPSGNAKFNAELSKKRAKAVQAALVSAGIPTESAALVKPANSADASVPKEAARRVEVTVQ